MPTTSRSFAETSALIRREEAGRRASIETPFGRRLVWYADLTATGRHLDFVERWMARVRPLYANSHTAVSSTGRLITELREQARQVVRRGVNASPDDMVLFVGSGATAAVNKLVGLLGLRIPEPLEREFGFGQNLGPEQRPLIFVGPYEHHSNELPWLETVADVVEIGLTEGGQIDLAELERRLAATPDRPLRIGSFSAASNVTGIISDVPSIARMLHRHGAYAFFDYAAAGPYVPIDMHPGDPDARLDAIFLSTHKFIGGPEASGVLVAHRELFRTRTPERPGGGTVDYVAALKESAVDYVRCLEEREEGGTPAILGDMRAGAAFLVKEMLGPQRILDHEIALARTAYQRLGRHPRIALLGPAVTDRLAIVSFNIEGLHHDFASALLDHLFGIQNRAGCACAGPYGHRLLGIDLARSERFRRLIGAGVAGMKPGWVRLSLPYYASDEDLEYLFAAVELVADHGEAFVPCYRLDWSDGVWRHLERPNPSAAPLQLDLDQLLGAAEGHGDEPVAAPLSDEEIQDQRARYLDEARRMVAELRARWDATPPAWNPPTGHPEVDELIWFRYVHSDGLEAR